MTPDISERAFEAAIECALLRDGPDACPGDVAAVRESPPTFGDEPAPGGYHRRRPEDYGRALCLLPADVVDSLLATQPREWERLEQHHGADVKPRFLARLSREIRSRGRLPNLSTFAFTATPKPKTLELFGTKRDDGKFEPFHRYSMRQAIEEGFILDVLGSYSTWKAYWRLSSASGRRRPSSRSPSTASWWSRASSRPASTSPCCTPCTWTRSSAA